MTFEIIRKANPLTVRIVLFANLIFATYCKSVTCATPFNTRIFASDLVLGDFHAILRGVFVKKIHNFSLFKFSSGKAETVRTFTAVRGRGRPCASPLAPTG